MSIKFSKLRDVVKVTDPLSVEKTSKNILAQLKRSPPTFNYGPAKKIEKAIFAGKVKTEASVEAACKKGTELSVKCNTEAALGLFTVAGALCPEPVMCHPLKKGIIYPFKQDQALLIQPTFFFSKDGKVHIPWTQYNKGDRYSDYQLSLIATILKNGFSEHFDDPEILLIDLSAPSKAQDRETRFWFASELPLLEEHQLEQFFQVYIEAVTVLEKNGYTVGKTGKDSPMDDDGQMDLF
jgi:hypothetical protein